MRRTFKISVSPGAALLFAGAVCFLDTDILICLAVSVSCHEAGHFIALRLFRAPVESISVTASGLAASFERSGLSYGAEALCALSGPLFGALLAFAASAAGLPLLAGVSLILTLFNLLPAYPLDGGRVFLLICSYIFGAKAGERAAYILGAAVAAAVFGLGLYLCYFLRAGITLPVVGAWLLITYCKTFGNGVK